MPDFQFGILSLRIGRIIVVEPGTQHWAHGLAKRVAVNRGTAHRILRQFERQGWLASRAEHVKERPKTVRVVYELTRSGADAISAALAPFQMLPRHQPEINGSNHGWAPAGNRLEEENAAWLSSYLATHSSAAMRLSS